MMTASELEAVLALADRWGDGRTVGADCRERTSHRLITMVNGGHPGRFIPSSTTRPKASIV